MPLYAYKSIKPDGKAVRAEVEAATEEQARALLRNRGIPVVKLQLVAGGPGSSAAKKRKRRKVNVDQQAVVFQELAVLIRAGIPVTEALDGLKHHVRSPVLTEALTQVQDDLIKGESFSSAIQQHPDVFPQLAADMISVAEAGGTLSESLERLAGQLESSADIARKVKAAMSYPMVVVAISILTLVALITFILPRFLTLFEQMNVELPLSTRMLMAVSSSSKSYWYAWLAGALAAYSGGRKAAASPRGKDILDRFFLRAPVIGDLYTKIVTARALTTLATLLKAGVPMMVALETAGSSANNEVVKSALRETKADLAAGIAFSASIKRTGVFPPLVLQVASAGEKTGDLAEMLFFACEYYTKEVDAKLKSLTSIIEPILIVGLGAFVGFIALSIILPIYSIVGGVK